LFIKCIHQGDVKHFSINLELTFTPASGGLPSHRNLHTEQSGEKSMFLVFRKSVQALSADYKFVYKTR
jgi:hypothetical protein